MAFWSSELGPNSAGVRDPKRKFRFKIRFDGLMADQTVVWWAKTVGKPSYTITESEHSFLTHKFYYPGRVEWGEIEMTLVDPVDPFSAAAQINALVEASGYIMPGSPSDLRTMSKGKSVAAIGNIHIDQIDAEGNTIESWELKNPFIKSAKFGDLDYTGDELTEISLSLRYDWAVCTINQGKVTQNPVGYTGEGDKFFDRKPS